MRAETLTSEIDAYLDVNNHMHLISISVEKVVQEGSLSRKLHDCSQ